MREGSCNEVELVKALVGYHTANRVAYRRKLAALHTGGTPFLFYNSKKARFNGLVESKGCSILADSSDAIIVASEMYDIDHGSAVEIKTMTVVRSIEAATTLSEKYGPGAHWRTVEWTKKAPKYFENWRLRQSTVPRYCITQLL